MTCLIIDDNTKTRDRLSGLLKASGAFEDIHHAVQLRVFMGEKNKIERIEKG